MNQKNYATSFSVNKTPKEVFDAVNNVRSWWSQEINGETDKPGAVFQYHFKDVHRATFRITEFVPEKKVVWHVLDNAFNFTKDQTEWKDTDIVFEINRKGNKTELRFTHIGLTPSYECYSVCSNAWGSYINSSLHDLITKGKGNPNPIEKVVRTARQMSKQNFTVTIHVDQSPDEVYAAVNNVRGWWSEEIVGNTDKLGAEFKFHYKDFHYSTHKITELVPGKKVVWITTDSRINFVKDKSEWKNTQVVFDITGTGDGTELRFTHIGLVPAVECFESCSDAWETYITESLYSLITSGKGKPNPKEGKPKAA